jgi:5-methylthioadenosine/S-adenosylhomocysteine deaminase
MSGALKNVDKLILHGLVVTMDVDSRQLDDGAVAVSGRDIVAVGPSSEISQQYTADEVIDASGHVVMPGLINAHTHLAMTLLRGFVGDVTTQDFLAKVWPVEGKYMTPENVRLGTQLAIAEMMRGGTTTAMDMYWNPQSGADAASRAGFRLITGLIMNDFITDDDLTVTERVERGRTMLESLQDDPLLIPAVLPHAVYTTSPETLKETWALAEELDVIWHTHASENDAEVETVRGQYGATPIEHLNKHGLLGKRTVLAHVVSPTDEDIEILAASGASVAHCPISNLKTGAGIAPLVKFKAAGVPVLLGTDGTSSSNDLDLWKVMRFAAILHRGVVKDPTFNPASDVVRMATCDAAAALGLGEIIGSIEPGKRADILLIDLNAPHLVPMYDVYDHLVYCVGREDVSTVLINGQVVMDCRALLTLNEKSLMDAARRLGKQIKGEDAAGQ